MVPRASFALVLFVTLTQLAAAGATQQTAEQQSAKPAAATGNSGIAAATRPSSGPVPPGIEPQVDVMWNVMSRQTCSDQYGSRVSRYYFCIDVVFGNNSGYPLLIAAVGFRRQEGLIDYRESAASYVSTRSVVQTGHILSARNISLRALQATGMLMAGLAPFIGNEQQDKWATWTSIVGATGASAFDTLVPDRTIRQAANLDDAALRDGRLIPNNSPVRFTVFVERETLAPLLLRRGSRLMDNLLAAEIRTAELGNVKGVSETDSIRRNQLLAAWKAYLEQTKAEIALLAPEQLRDYLAASGSEQRSGPGRKLASVLASYDSANGKRHRLGASKFPLFRFLARKGAEAEEDLVAVRHALGTLVVVGDQIEYRQRLQVDGKAVSPEVVPEARIESVQGEVVQGKESQVVVYGAGLSAVSISASNCNPTFEQVPDSSGKKITLAAFTVSHCTSEHIRLVGKNGSSSPLEFHLEITPAPTITAIGNKVTYDADGGFTLKLSGKHLDSVRLESVVISNGTQTDEDALAPGPKLEASEAGLSVTAKLRSVAPRVPTVVKVVVRTPKGGASNEVEFELIAGASSAPTKSPDNLTRMPAATDADWCRFPGSGTGGQRHRPR